MRVIKYSCERGGTLVICEDCDAMTSREIAEACGAVPVSVDHTWHNGDYCQCCKREDIKND